MKTQKKPAGVLDSDQTTSYSHLSDSISEVDTTASSDEAQLEDEERRQAKIRNNEYIFLIDRSGSMGGVPIQLAVKALKVFLHSLPIGCLFNVYSFGSKYEVLFPDSMEYT
jgi:Mg-chelatase subunit ChlD